MGSLKMKLIISVLAAILASTSYAIQVESAPNIEINIDMKDADDDTDMMLESGNSYQNGGEAMLEASVGTAKRNFCRRWECEEGVGPNMYYTQGLYPWKIHMQLARVSGTG